MIKSTLTAAALGVALLSGPAMAEGQKPTTQIEYRDLNLSTSEGQKALDRRIEVAAKQICRFNEQTTGSHVKSPDRMACVKAAKASAKQQVAALIERERLGG